MEGNYILSALEDYASVTNISFTHDGQMLATVKNNGEIQFWNLVGEQMSTRLDTKQQEITGISFSSIKSIIAVADRSGTVNLWDWSKIEQQGLIPNPNQETVNLMSFSGDSKYLVTVGSDTTKLWNVSNPQQPKFIKTLKDIKYSGGVSSVGFSSDGRIAIAARGDSKVNIWSASGKILQPLDTQHQGIIAISFSQTNVHPFLATAGTDGIIKVWDWFKRKQIAEFKSDLKTIISLNFSPDGKKVIAGGDDGSIEDWSVQNLEELLETGCNWLEDYHSNNSESATAKLCSEKTKNQTA
ncbi:MAG: hypothetical protein HC930_04105 [Hydrococcus sp. SU_1_0]|nr:hypothetical protein [Hydrococcus sp. SU_1_0]